MDFGSRDRISGLPNPLISHILSFLPTKEAASTSVLSKKWRFLFASVTNLDFDDSMSENENSTSFMEFVDRVLALQGNSPVNRFALNCSGYDVDLDRATGWISNVLGRGVSDLDLSLSEYPLPSDIFVSKSLVRLKLEGDLSFTTDVKDVSLPKLKILHLDAVAFIKENAGLAKLLSGCPVLEELVLMNLGWENWKSCSVSSRTLKRLKFLCEDEDPFGNPKRVSFDTPNLVYLEYSDAIADKYRKVKFGSLVEAHIGLRLSDNQDAADADNSDDDFFSEDDDDDEENKKIGKAATDFLTGICNVQILYLSARVFEVLAFCGELKPVFKNLIQLTIESNPEIGWESLPGLIKNCPNLQTLVFKGLVHKYNKKRCGDVCGCKRLKKNVASCLSSSPVKVVKIFMFEEYDEDMSETEQIKHFLEKMPRLEELIVYYKTSYDPSVFELSKKLQRIPKIASPKCKIQVISDNLSLSSTLPSSLSTKWAAPPPEEVEDDEEEEKAKEYDPYYLGAYDCYDEDDYNW